MVVKIFLVCPAFRVGFSGPLYSPPALGAVITFVSVKFLTFETRSREAVGRH